MALAKLKPVYEELAASPTVRAAGPPTLMGNASPAALLQQRIQAETALQAASDKWPLGQRAALILASSIALWMMLITAFQQVIHAIA